MVELKFSFSAGNSQKRLYIDGKRITLDGNGDGGMRVNPGKDYAITWFVLGLAGSIYELKLISPSKVATRVKRKLDYTSKDAGLLWVTL